jgi:uncharacterized protein
MTQTEFISRSVSAPPKSIEATLKLQSEGCTIPFISRYRKDTTGNLDETLIEQIFKQKAAFDNIIARKETIISSIDEQNALTPELRKKIEESFDLAELEDLYLPYKKRRKTRADIARENGLEPLAKIIMAQNADDIDFIASKYLGKNIQNEDDALAGARDIIAEWISENLYIRRQIRRLFQRRSTISAKIVKAKADEENAQKFRQYFDWSEPLSKTPPHRLLAMLRGENEGFIRLKVDIDSDEAIALMRQSVIKNNRDARPQLEMAIDDSFKRLLAPSLSNEALQEAKSKADAASIEVFAGNLGQLLMAPPLGTKRIMAIDPGFRSGCKVVCLDEHGDLLYNETIFPHPPQNESAIAMKKIRSMANAYKIDAISIGNGTASRETEAFIKKIAFDKPLQVFIVSEAGASVYSASKVARDEFPDYDVTVGGAVSIGRRLSDPLAELVKIDPKAIGVGQYQHDVDQGKLRDELDRTVIRCVNSVGVNLNTASKHLLAYVSGIGEKMAGNIVDFRSENGPFKSREELKKVPRLGEKAFQQSAAFVRVKGENPLDDSAVHPESYGLVSKIAKDVGIPLNGLIGNKAITGKIDISKYVGGKIGEIGLRDIVKELEKPGLDPRQAAKVFEFDPTFRTLDDVRAGMIVPGIVNNITQFGCFVDIGIKESGLVHISQLKQGFVANVSDVVKLHQHVMVKVLEVDGARRRIQLGMVL